MLPVLVGAANDALVTTFDLLVTFSANWAAKAAFCGTIGFLATIAAFKLRKKYTWFYLGCFSAAILCPLFCLTNLLYHHALLPGITYGVALILLAAVLARPYTEPIIRVILTKKSNRSSRKGK